MLRFKNYFLVLVLLSGLLSAVESVSQNSSSSAYSRYGMGDLLFSGYTKNLGMGGLGQAVNQPLSLNPLNPASYSGLALTTYEMGFHLTFSEQATTRVSQNNTSAALGYFAFAFPVMSRKWGLGFGLLPYSNVGYSVQEARQNDIGELEVRTYDGSGGLNQFYLTNGFNLAKNFSAGVTVSYLFGVINQERRVEFNDVAYFNTNLSNSNSLGWFHAAFGLQYTFDSLRTGPSDSIRTLDTKLNSDLLAMKNLDKSISELAEGEARQNLLDRRMSLDSSYQANKKIRSTILVKSAKSDWSLGFGFTIAPATNLRGKESVLSYNFKYLSNITKNQIIIRDTITNTEEVKGNVHLPLNAGIGFTIKKSNRWLFGADFSTQQWSDFTYFGRPDSLVDSWKVSIGAQFTPNERALKSYYKQVQYRFGYHFGNSFLDLNGTHLKEMAATIGFGFPIKRVGTTVQFAAEVGKRGTIQNELVQEKYIRFSLSFTLNDRWFIKPKYD